MECGHFVGVVSCSFDFKVTDEDVAEEGEMEVVDEPPVEGALIIRPAKFLRPISMGIIVFCAIYQVERQLSYTFSGCNPICT